MIINAILEVLDDGRFVVVYNDDQITTLTVAIPDLSAFDNVRDAWLAGVAYSQLRDPDSPSSHIRVVESEDL